MFDHFGGAAICLRVSLMFVIFLSSSFFAITQSFAAPPEQAIRACSAKSSGSKCSFFAPHGTVTGLCSRKRENRLLCVPSYRMGRGTSENQSGSAFSHPTRALRVEISSENSLAQKVQSNIPDTGQGSCFDGDGKIDCPKIGKSYFGQDGEYSGTEADYIDHHNGTVSDAVTGLIWQQAHNEQRLGFFEATRSCSNLKLGGYSDWRLPEIKELFSIADFSGGVGRKAYLNSVFEIQKPSAEILKGDRFAATHRTEMMGQTWSNTIYSGDHWDRKGVEAAFFFNFLDGRIKQAPTHGRNGLFYRCVRGDIWGGNDFVANHNGTVSDRNSMLTWMQADDGKRRNWKAALAYCENLELAGQSDWRLPNVKELQSIIDYSKHDPAINQRYFRQRDKDGWFWSSTTHGDNITHAAYVCFGHCVSVDGVDVHGAGAQRSDPKSGNASSFGSMGGQRDAVRIDNYARCVRSEPL